MEPLQDAVDSGAAFDVQTLDYGLPRELIAQSPAPQRAMARLLVVDRNTDSLQDQTIQSLPALLQPNDLLVLNDTRVLPARFQARRATGGLVPGLFLEESRACVWRVMLEGSKRLRVGELLSFAQGSSSPLTATLIESLGEGQWHLRLSTGGSAVELLEQVGRTPLPPYIHRDLDAALDDSDRTRYQTVYARAPGSVAAPTAGLHFTEELLNRIRTRGVDIAFVTLHVGLGTFKPLAVDCLTDHVMHKEPFELSEETASAINRCRALGGRVVAVGTTTVRVLETAARIAVAPDAIAPGHGSTGIFIYPPFKFRVVDALLTNFHLPRSTLLALVMAFAGVDRVRRAYAYAVAQKYRFYSFGDAMLIV